MAKQKFTVTYEDGTVREHLVKPRHLVSYEDSVDLNTENPKIADGFKLAWIAAETGLSFPDWLNSVDDIETPEQPVATEVTVNTTGEAAEPVPTA